VIRDLVIGILLGTAALVVLLSSLGLLVMRDLYQRLHYVTPISLISTPLVAAALTVREGWDENTAAAWLTVAFVVVVAPYVSHATIRAARIRDRGDWRETSRREQRRTER